MSVASRIKRNHQVVSRSTRQSNLLTVPRARTRQGQRTFLCRSAKLYNAAVIRKNRQGLVGAKAESGVKTRVHVAALKLARHMSLWSVLACY